MRSRTWHMRSRTWLWGAVAVLGLGLTVAACDSEEPIRSLERSERASLRPAPPPPTPQAGTLMEADMIAVTGSRVTRDDISQGEPSPNGPSQEPAEQMLAYTYRAAIEVPADNVADLMAAHEQACRAAGPAKCQVLSASVNKQAEDYVYAELSLRGAPGWITPFRNGLADDAEAADGALVESSMDADDLTRTILDTTARLEAQRTLRERLLKLLEKDTDQVSDLLQVERELARVQAQIESAESNLAYYRSRVNMDRLDLSYRTKPKPITSSAFEPLVNALVDFAGVLFASLGTLILVIAALLPWAAVGIPALWLLVVLIRRWVRRRKSASL